MEMARAGAERELREGAYKTCRSLGEAALERRRENCGTQSRTQHSHPLSNTESGLSVSCRNRLAHLHSLMRSEDYSWNTSRIIVISPECSLTRLHHRQIWECSLVSFMSQ